ncbi:MAG: DNA topoisomerase VI subunit B [Candidatus Hodarchaeales archaeon]|jgi:DNA topoisomerase-6 subunit B
MTTEEVVRRSAADFFHDNKAIAGFDNPMRAVFTSVRELVENGLDAAEKRGVPPKIICKIERLEPDEVATLLGIDKVEEAPGSAEYLRLSVTDNGTGVPHRYIPMLFGRVLTGSNYGARQTRGRFGLGAKMVLLNAMATVDLPIQIKSRYSGPLGVEENTSYYELIIDLQKNEPIIKTEEEHAPMDTRALEDAGTEITVSFTGNIRAARRYVMEYFHQLSIITPHATFIVSLPGEEPRIQEAITDNMPDYPQTTKVHPYGTDITQLKREIAVTTSQNMLGFLQQHFQGVDKRGVAEDFLREVGISFDRDPKELSSSEIRRMVHEGFQRAQVEAQTVKRKSDRRFKFGDPKGDALSPLGARRLELGLERELNPEFIWGIQRKPSAYSGHSFIIETAVAYGGRRHYEDQEGESAKRRKKWLVYRFANRIPLLFGEGSDVITRAINEIDWSKDYKISENLPLAFAVSLVSTKIPFPETSKEYIANVLEIRNEVIRALRACGRQLRTFHSRRAREKREQSRRSKFEASAPKVVSKLFDIVESHQQIFPYDLTEARHRMSAALATGVPKRARRHRPPSEPIYAADTWIDPRLEKELMSKEIKTINDFLITSAFILARSKGLSRAQARSVKRKTVTMLDHHPRTRRIGQIGIISSRADNIDPDILPYESALSRKWITTAYDFLATSTEDLLAVEGFDRKLIQQEKINIAQQFAGHSLKIQDLEGLAELSKPLKRKEISTAFDFLAASALELLKVKGLPATLVKQMKQRINESGADRSRKIESDSFPWMKYAIRKDLASKDIISIEDMLAAGVPELQGIESLVLALLEHERSLLKDQLNLNTDVPLIRDLDWLDIKEASTLRKAGIKTIPDFLNESLHRLASIAGQFISKTLMQTAKERIHQKQNSDPRSLLISQMYWIPEAVESTFSQRGIKTIFDALSLPIPNLLEIEGVKQHQIERLKQTYGTSLDILGDYSPILKEAGILCLEELFDDPQQTLLASNIDKQIIETIISFLTAPAYFLPHFPYQKARELHQVGVSRVIDLLVWDFEAGILDETVSSEQLQMIKEKATLKAVQTNIEQLALPVQFFASIDPKIVGEIESQGILTIQDFYFKHFTLPRRFNKSRDNIESLLSSPIVLLKDINPPRIDLLIEQGIIQVIDLLFCPNTFLERELNLSEQEVISLKESCLDLRKGTSLELFRPEKERSWTRRELNSLKSAQITTVEQLYFNTEKANFSAVGIPWKTVDRLKRKLEAPIAMIETISLEETMTAGQEERTPDETTEQIIEIESDESVSEQYVRPLSGIVLDKLTDAGATTVLQSIWWPIEYLAERAQLSKEEIAELRKEFAVRETGIPLDVLDLERKVIRQLEELGVDKVEELYFSLTPEECEEEKIPWKPIEAVRNLLDAPLALFDRISSDELDKLRNRGISTILRFLLGSSTELAQILGASEERIDELRHLLDFKIIRENFFSPITLLRDLPITSFEKLAEVGIDSVGDFWLASGKDLTDLTGLALAEIASIKNTIGAKKVARFREEEASLSELFGLSRGVARKLQRAELSSISDIFLLTEETLTSFQGDAELQTVVKAIKMALDSPVAFIDNVPRSSLPLLLNAGISTVGRFLISQPDDLAKILEVDVAILNEINEDLNLQTTTEILQLPFHVLSDFASSRKLTAELTNAGFRFVGDLVSELHKSQAIPEELRILAYDILSGIDPLSIIQSLSIPLYVVDSIPEEIVSSLRKRRIADLYQLVRNPELLVELPLAEKEMPQEESTVSSGVQDPVSDLPSSLEKESPPYDDLMEKEITEDEEIAEEPEIDLEVQAEDEFLLLDFVDFHHLHEIMELPIGYAPEFTPKDLTKLAEDSGIRSIRNLIQTSTKELASLLGISSRDAKNRLESITIKRIKTRMNQIGVPLFLLKVFDTHVLQKASVGGYSWFGDLYFMEKAKAAEFFPKVQLRAFFGAANTTLAYVDNIPSSILQSLRREGYSRIRDFLLLSDEELKRIFNASWSDVKHLRASINFEQVIVHRESGRCLDTEILLLEPQEEEAESEVREQIKLLLAELEKHDIRYLIELGFLGQEIIDLISEQLQPLLQRIIFLIESPIFFLPPIESKIAKKLTSEGINTILEFLCRDPAKLAEYSGILREDLVRIIVDMKLIDISQARKEDQITIADINAFPSSAQQELEDQGFYGIRDVLFRLKPEFVRSATWKAVETVKEFLAYPVSYHIDLLDQYPSRIFSLADGGIHSLGDLLSWSPDNLGKELNCDMEEARALQLSTDISLLRRRKKGLGIRIEKIQGLSRKLLKILEENSIETIDQILFADLSSVIQFNPRLQKEVMKLRETLRRSPDHIKGIGWAKKEQLLKSGISSVFDFLIRPEKQLADLLKIPLSQLREIRNEPELIPILDREKLAKVFNLSTAERKHLESVGLHSTYDLQLLENRAQIQELIPEEKPRAIAEKIYDVLRCPVSFFDDISLKYIPHIADGGVTTTRDFLAALDDIPLLSRVLGENINEIEHVRRYPTLKRALHCIHIQITAFQGLMEFRSFFAEKGIVTLSDLLDSIETTDFPPEATRKLLMVTPATLMDQMDIQLSLPGFLPPEILSALKKRKVSNLYQLACLSPTAMHEIETDVQKNNPDIAFPRIDFARVVRAFNLPICFAFGFSPIDYRKLADADLRTIGSLISTDPRVVARITSQKTDKVRNSLNKVTLESIDLLEGQIGTPLADLSFFSGEELQSLSENGISQFEDIYFANKAKLQSLIPSSTLERFFRIANAPSIYIDEISSENISVVREYMPRIADFILLPDPFLTALLSDDWRHMKKMRFKPDFGKFESSRKRFPQLEQQTQLESTLLKKLEVQNVENLVDIAFIGDEILPKLAPKEKKVIQGLKKLLESDITLLDNLDEEKSAKLAETGISTVLKWLYWDPAQLSKLLDKNDTEINTQRIEFHLDQITKPQKKGRARKKKTQSKPGTKSKSKRQKSLNAFQKRS